MFFYQGERTRTMTTKTNSENIFKSLLDDRILWISTAIAHPSCTLRLFDLIMTPVCLLFFDSLIYPFLCLLVNKFLMYLPVENYLTGGRLLCTCAMRKQGGNGAKQVGHSPAGGLN